MKKHFSILALVLTLVLCVSLLGGCGQTVDAPAAEAPVEEAAGGVIHLKVNPEIAVLYNVEGIVTGVESRNADAKVILEDYTDFEGKTCREVLTELVELIGDAGYFVEEIDGKSRAITIEIESGSLIPDKAFLDQIADDVRAYVQKREWHSPVAVAGNTDYGISDYVDTDYGPNADGVTDYDDTDYGPNADGVTDFGVTDYDDTDYGPNADGVTDFGVSDYDDTDYGPNADGVTDFGVSDYDDTDYGPNADGVTDFGKTDYNDPATDYGKTDYSDPATDYGKTDYADKATDYGRTDYDASDYGN